MRTVRESVVVAMLFGDACMSATESQPSESQPSTPSSTAPATRIGFDLVADVGVILDGVEVGRTPLEPIATTPGVHEVRLSTRCGQFKAAPVEATAGETLLVTRAHVPDLKFAKLRLKLRALYGETLAPKVWADESALALDDRGEAELLACKRRVRIESGHPAVGGFMEDIEFAGGQKVERDLVLAPGPDMVRLPGGRFRGGEHPADEPAEDEEPPDYILPYEVRIAPFDIDRSEVTAAQWYLCRTSGGCEDRDSSHWIHHPNDQEQCTTDLQDRTPRPGQESFPLNCVTFWEAELYCKWAGKRLPTVEEWEYAARGASSENNCPWGVQGDDVCDRRPAVMSKSGFRIFPVDPVCSHPRDNSAQGVCDLADGMSEYSAQVRYDRKRSVCIDYESPESSKRRAPVKDAAERPFEIEGCYGTYQQHPRTGFRCARSLGGDTSRKDTEGR